MLTSLTHSCLHCTSAQTLTRPEHLRPCQGEEREGGGEREGEGEREGGGEGREGGEGEEGGGGEEGGRGEGEMS